MTSEPLDHLLFVSQSELAIRRVHAQSTEFDGDTLQSRVPSWKLSFTFEHDFAKKKLVEGSACTGKMIGEDKSSRAERVLGITWLPDEDLFMFDLILPDDLQRMATGNGTVTKRGISR